MLLERLLGKAFQYELLEDKHLELRRNTWIPNSNPLSRSNWDIAQYPTEGFSICVETERCTERGKRRTLRNRRGTPTHPWAFSASLLGGHLHE
jgi:hypothetical protein